MDFIGRYPEPFFEIADGCSADGKGFRDGIDGIAFLEMRLDKLNGFQGPSNYGEKVI